MSEKIIVIGGTAAGLSAATKAKRINPDLEISVYEKTGYSSYGSCGLPYYISNLIKEEAELISLTPDKLINNRKINISLNHEVIKIDRSKKCLSIKNLTTGDFFEDYYDKLVIATGSRPFIPEIEGIDKEKVYVLRTVEDGIAIKNEVSKDNIASITIVGGGFISLEIAEQLQEMGKKVNVVEIMDRLLPFLYEEYSQALKDKLEAKGIKVINALAPSKIESEFQGGHKTYTLKLSDDSILKSDFIIIAAGVKPNSEIARECGLDLGFKNTIYVDEYLQTSDDNIFACGDCAQSINIITNSPTYLPLGTVANKQGKTVGENLAGKNTKCAGVLGSGVTKVFDLYIAKTGLSAFEAEQAGFDVVTKAIEKDDKASYYPGGKTNKINLIFEKKFGRLLGAQAIGSESIVGRINALAVAISAKMTVSTIKNLDLLYCPAVAPVYDPILIAASQAENKLKE